MIIKAKTQATNPVEKTLSTFITSGIVWNCANSMPFLSASGASSYKNEHPAPIRNNNILLIPAKPQAIPRKNPYYTINILRNWCWGISLLKHNTHVTIISVINQYFINIWAVNAAFAEEKQFQDIHAVIQTSPPKGNFPSTSNQKRLMEKEPRFALNA